MTCYDSCHFTSMEGLIKNAIHCFVVFQRHLSLNILHFLHFHLPAHITPLTSFLRSFMNCCSLLNIFTTAQSTYKTSETWHHSNRRKKYHYSNKVQSLLVKSTRPVLCINRTLHATFIILADLAFQKLYKICIS